MSEARAAASGPARIRVIIATLLVIATVVIVWKVIDYRMRPPPPPHKIGQRVEIK
jgi:hypothetical protein